VTQPRIGLIGLGAYLPERVMTNADWAEHVDTSDEWIVERTGIRRRRFAADHESTADLAINAARSALEDAGLGADAIDEIVVASDTPEVYSPDTAAFVQTGLGAREIPAYDLGSSGCAGFVLALDVARARAMQRDRKILVVGVELLSRLMDWTDRNTCVLFGDAAGAAIVGRTTDGPEILAANAGTDGSRHDILGVEVGGTRVPFNEERARAREHQHLVMKGREVFREAVHRMTASAHALLDEAGLSLDDVSLVIPHQANLRILEAVRDRLGLPDEKIFINVHEYGNTGSASVPLALWDARRQGRIRAGDVVLLTAFGAGFHWSGVLLRVPKQGSPNGVW
jgi:3-oxoacyl-[acyl-carrier-protein] synthase III